MRPEDWEQMYYEEFDAVCKAYMNHEEAAMKDKWERMRLLASIVIQPHVKKRIGAKDLVPLPWDKKKDETPIVSKEEAMKEFKRTAALAGLEI